MTRQREPGPGQADLIAETQLVTVPACLYQSAARGLAARAADYADWQAKYGGFGSLVRSHAWTVPWCSPDEPTPRCQPTILDVNLRAPDWPLSAPMPGCDCTTTVDELLYRGACRNPDCNWEGDPVGEENRAVEDAADHAWPGWRDMPIIGQRPHDKKLEPRWAAKAILLYPAGWLEAGGPIRTARTPGGIRHNWQYATPWGGYDIGVAG
jgi:Family of unknown function (DUF6349)